MLIDQPQALPLTRREQFDRIFGDDRTGDHDSLVKRGGAFSSTWRSDASAFRL
jgi:hypothetical protein